MLKSKTVILALAATCMLMSCNKKIQYPAAPADGTVYEVNGVTVNDNYRPLEDDTSAVTREWVQQENSVTRAYLDAVPFRSAIAQRIDSIFTYSTKGTPWKGNDGMYYWWENDGTQNQNVLYRSHEPYGADAAVFIDPNALSDEGTVALTGLTQSKDGKYTAYTVSRNGSDWVEIYVMDTATGQLLDDHIEWAKFTDAVWDSDSFYYSAYDRPVAGKEYSSANEYHKIYRHRLGTPQSADELVFEDKDAPLHFHTADTAGDGRYLLVYASGQGHGSSLMIKDKQNPAKGWVTVEPSQDYTLSILDAPAGDRLFAFTNIDAPRNRLVRIDPANPGRENWETVLPESPDGAVLSSISFAGNDRMIAVYDRDASLHAGVYDLDGRKLYDVELPTFGTVGFSADKDSEDVFYLFSSFAYPTSIYKLDLASGGSTLLHRDEVAGLTPEDYVTEQVFVTSSDGTRIPMFIVRRSELEKNSDNPVYMYGYGGFNIGLNPYFSASRAFWLENGGIYVLTNLRGGSEYGDDWHKAGTMMQKKNVFNDFIACTEYMINEGWTRPELVTAEGGSNGGLLVGAVVNMRPDLFGVAIPRVGVMDMMRYHLFTIGWNWAHDYGTADDSPEMAEYLLSYSPYHNIRTDGTHYPAIMVTTADHDDRVVPAHSFKYAAAIQAAETGDAPKLIRIDSNAGHGAGKPVSKTKDEWTDIYTFIFKNIGREPVK